MTGQMRTILRNKTTISELENINHSVGTVICVFDVTVVYNHYYQMNIDRETKAQENMSMKSIFP